MHVYTTETILWFGIATKDICILYKGGLHIVKSVEIIIVSKGFGWRRGRPLFIICDKWVSKLVEKCFGKLN